MASEKPVLKPAPKAAKAKAPAAAGVSAKAPQTPQAPQAPKAPEIQMKEVVMTNEALTKSLEAVAPAVEKAATDFLAQTHAAHEQASAKVREMMEKNMKTMNEMTEFAKGNMEALIESAKAAATGAEAMTSHFVESSKKSAEEAQAAFKSFSTAKTPNDLITAHNDFAKAQFDKAVANMSHMSETWLKLAGEVVQPLSSRMSLAAETVKKSMAA